LRQASSYHRCIVCLCEIGDGVEYRDGGYPRRAHVECAELVVLGQKRELSRDDLRELEEAEDAVSEAKAQVHRAEQNLRAVRAKLLGATP